MKPPQARSAIKRALKSIVDRDLTSQDKDRVWSYFKNRCAFCGVDLSRSDRKGHVDHLVPESKGGRNSLVNRVLSCGKCNGDEKLDHDWQLFLHAKVEDADDYAERHSIIEAWIQQHGGRLTLDKEMLEMLEAEFKRVNQVFTDACDNVRKAI